MDHVVGWLFLGFWVVFGVAIVVRLVLALRRRRRGSSLRDWVLRPVLAAGTATVWPTQDTRTTEHLEHAHGGAGQQVGTSVVEPWPGEPEESWPGEPGEPSGPGKPAEPGEPSGPGMPAEPGQADDPASPPAEDLWRDQPQNQSRE